MSLPKPWVDHLFKKLSLAYGRAFLDQYKDVDPEDVRADWADFLAHYVNHPAALSYALDNLPADKPVNALQFRNLCRQAPLPEAQALPAPAPNPAAVARGQEKLKELATKLRSSQPDPMAIVRNLETKLNNCERLSAAQRDWLKAWYARNPKEPAVPAHQ